MGPFEMVKIFISTILHNNFDFANNFQHTKMKANEKIIPIQRLFEFINIQYECGFNGKILLMSSLKTYN